MKKDPLQNCPMKLSYPTVPPENDCTHCHDRASGNEYGSEIEKVKEQSH
jgi:hypothetical protein